MSDPTRFRVTLICSCKNDVTEGYGPTPELAHETAVRYFRKLHGRRAKWIESIVEEAVPNRSGSGSHYEPVSP